MGQKDYVEFHLENITMQHKSGSTLSFSNLKANNLFQNIDALSYQKGSIWYESEVSEKEDEFKGILKKNVKHTSIEFNISNNNEVLDFDVKDDSYIVEFKGIAIQVNDSLPNLIRELEEAEMFHTDDEQFNFINIPFMHSNLIRGKKRLSASSKSLLIYYDKKDNCIESIRIVEWD